MKDVVKLSEAGGTLGFPIKRSIRKALELKYKDPVEFDIIDKKGNIITTLHGELKKDNTISIKFFVSKEYSLTSNQVLQVDIRRAD